ncbi:MAG: ABC transporter substrate-binding protein [archaeon]
MKKKSLLILIIVIIIIALIIAFMPKEQKEDVIKIGGAFGLTGFANTWGEADRNGALLAIEEINELGGVNGKKVKLIIEDTKSEQKDTLSAVTKLIEVDNVDVIIGPTWMDTFLGPAPLSNTKNIIMMEPSAAVTAVKSEENYKNIFVTWYRSDAELQILPKYISENNINNIVIIRSNDIFWEDTVFNLRKGSEKYEIQILAEYKINPTDTDLRTPITKAKEKNPDAIFFGFNSEQNLAGFLKQRQEIYPKSELITTESIEEFLEKKDFKPLLTNLRFIAPKILESNFNEEYKDRFKIDPIYSASNSYDATRIILQAIEQTDSTNTDDLREYIKNNEFNTVTFGKTRFDEIGGVIGGEFVIKNEKGEIIDTLD